MKIKEGIVTPWRGWGLETHDKKGHVVGLDAHEKSRIKFQWRENKPWNGNLADIALDNNISNEANT